MTAEIVAYLNEAFMLVSAGSAAVGWYLIRRGRREAHRRAMLTSVVLAAAFFLSYVLKTIFIGDTSFGGPAQWREPYQIFLQAHSVLATVAAVLGIVALRYAFKSRFASHKRIGPWTVTIWLITAATGLMVFLLLYVIYEPGPTRNMFRTWLGF
ncbi:DUF420 domain-containing protein [Kyrpidia spormannii]|uniref:DUF420 domain-containing protein n=1 Tax=Kyrpidia spormannii TaxID=2055160 RepID=A0A2K8N4B8_9BACL|nr:MULTISPECIES: DUF420 domain-containing protein [Kyrpidia]ATY84258.1 DUF420 domain-containing protein [Kyrpidia spormannii]MCL6577204.1 DUF420 domain-containing protein [Kyrpidia sp.]HHY65909.1 DUF420 domain-containing protein [Alicyclobacillus sp.]